jgi:hypothetical protein
MATQVLFSLAPEVFRLHSKHPEFLRSLPSTELISHIMWLALMAYALLWSEYVLVSTLTACGVQLQVFVWLKRALHQAGVKMGGSADSKEKADDPDLDPDEVFEKDVAHWYKKYENKMFLPLLLGVNIMDFVARRFLFTDPAMMQLFQISTESLISTFNAARFRGLLLQPISQNHDDGQFNTIEVVCEFCLLEIVPVNLLSATLFSLNLASKRNVVAPVLDCWFWSGVVGLLGLLYLLKVNFDEDHETKVIARNLVEVSEIPNCNMVHLVARAATLNTNYPIVLRLIRFALVAFITHCWLAANGWSISPKSSEKIMFWFLFILPAILSLLFPSPSPKEKKHAEEVRAAVTAARVYYLRHHTESTASEGQASADAPAESAETTATESAGLTQRKGASGDAHTNPTMPQGGGMNKKIEEQQTLFDGNLKKLQDDIKGAEEATKKQQPTKKMSAAGLRHAAPGIHVVRTPTTETSSRYFADRSPSPPPPSPSFPLPLSISTVTSTPAPIFTGSTRRE